MHPAATDAELLRLARAGDLDALFGHAAKDARDAYFWLLVAQDFGHEEAADRIGDIEECYDDFKYDDDGVLRVDLHLALGTAYLKGERGLDVNVDHALAHLGEYLDAASGETDEATGPEPSATEAGELSAPSEPGIDRARELRALAATLPADQRAAVTACIDAQPFRAVHRRVQRAQRFYDLLRDGVQVPSVIVEAELGALLVDAQALVALVRERI